MQKTVYEWDIESHTNVISWNNMSEDGWGVRKTDNSAPSNEIVSAPCTYINDKAVVSYSNMFNIYTNQAKKLDLSNFNTSNVTDMGGMFQSSKIVNLDLSSFNTSKVTDMGSMFAESQATILDLSNFNTSNVTYMSEMFSGSKATSIDLSNFNTSKVTSMNSMFQDSKIVNLDLSSFDTSNVTDMNWMFKDSQASVIKGLNNFNTSKVTSMGGMFENSKIEILDLSNFDTSKVTDSHNMFKGNINLKTIYASSKFNTSAITSNFNSRDMFTGCTNLVGGNGTTYDSTKVDKTYARIDTASTRGYFTAK